MNRRLRCIAVMVLLSLLVLSVTLVRAQIVTFLPYIRPGDNGPFQAKDQMIVTWQANEPIASPGAYEVQLGKSLAELHSARVDARVGGRTLRAQTPARGDSLWRGCRGLGAVCAW